MDAAREEYLEQAGSSLEDQADLFEAVGADHVERIAFGRDYDVLVDRIAAAEGCTATLLDGPESRIDSVLVALGRGTDAGRVGEFAGRLLADSPWRVKLLAVAPETDDDARAARSALADADDAVEAAGVDPDYVRREVVYGNDPSEATADVATEHDAVVVGGRAPSVHPRVVRDGPLDPGEVGPLVIVHGDPTVVDE